MSPPSQLPPHPTLLDCHRAPVWVSWAIQQIPIGCLFSVWYCKFPCHSLHSSHAPPSSLPLCPRVYSLCSLCLFLHCCPENRFIGTIFLDSTYMRQYMIFIFLFLTYFTLYNRLLVCPPHQNWLKCIPFMAELIFLHMYVPQLLYPLICRRAFRLLPCSSYCRMIVLQWTLGYVSFSILVSSWCMPRRGVAGSYGGFIPSFF